MKASTTSRRNAFNAQPVSRSPSPRNLERMVLASRDMARRRRRVLPASANASDHIAIAQGSEKSWNVCGIILPIGIMGDENFTCRLLHAEEERGSLSVVRSKMEYPRLGPALCHVVQLASRRILASVVDENPFVSQPSAVAHGPKLIQQRNNTLLLIKKGHDNGNPLPHWSGSELRSCRFVIRSVE